MLEIRKGVAMTQTNTLLSDLQSAIQGNKINRDMVDRFAEQEKNESMQISQMVRGNLANFEATDKPVYNALNALKNAVNDINPSNFKLSFFDKLFGKNKFMQKYFDKFQENQALLDSLVKKLEEGKQILLRDNVALEIEATKNAELAEKIKVQLQLALEANNYIESLLAQDTNNQSPTTQNTHILTQNQNVESSTLPTQTHAQDSMQDIYAVVTSQELSPEKRLEIQNQILFPLKQKITDFQQQILVHTQGEIAIKTLINNNKELANSVDRTKSVTLNALNVAIITSQGLDQQQRVLKAVNDINATTSDLLAQNATNLKQQGAAIQQGAANAMLDMEKLKNAFDDVLSAMEDTQNFRINALPKMQENIKLYNQYIDEMSEKKKRIMG